MKTSRHIAVLLTMLASVLSYADDNACAVMRRDTLRLDVSFDASASTNGSIRPLWSYSQEWGRYTQYRQGEALLYAKADYGWRNRKDWFRINVGAALQASTDKSRIMLHEAYVKGRIWKIDFVAGRDASTPLDQHSNMGLGTYLMSANARPALHAGAGFFDYWAIPGLRNWLEIKGGIYVGGMPNEEGKGFAKDVLTHEKFAYVRIGHFPTKLYLGLTHSVMMGGTLADGRTVPVDFWASFFAVGSKKLKEAGFEGEYYNACGAHQGLWDLGLEFDYDDFLAKVYYQRPFYDATAKNLGEFATCKDIHLGFDVELKKSRFVRHLNFEYFTTLWQGGNGNPDPIFISTGPERTGEVIGLPIKAVTPVEIRKYFSADKIGEWEAEHGPLKQSDVSDFLIKYANNGRPWGNRTPYLSHPDMYKQGWTVGGLSMGYPMFLSDVTMQTFAADRDYFQRFPCMRMMALNFGIAGNILPQLSYKAKFTYTDNYGNLREEYYEGVDFEKKRPNYYFEQCRTEIYSGLWLEWQFSPMWSFSGSVAWDFGQMYNSFSVRLGVRFRILPLQARKNNRSTKFAE